MAAGTDRGDVDSGAVILTGHALERRNARAIAEALAVDAGGLVCATAGHHLEGLLAAHGSGAVALSRARPGAVVLHADVGGRMLVTDPSGAVAALNGPTAEVAAAAGVDLAVGSRLSPGDEARLARTL